MAAGAALFAGAPEVCAASTSLATMRPPGPVPEIPESSTPLEAAIFLARGEALTRSPLLAGAGLAAADFAVLASVAPGGAMVSALPAAVLGLSGTGAPSAGAASPFC